MKSLRLSWSLFKLSVMADFQMPFNVFVQFFNDILWYLVQIVLFGALFLHVDNIGGWEQPQMRVFLGILFLVDAIHMMLFSHNLLVFSERVSRRDLDLVLLKPVNSLLMMTTQRWQTGFLLNILFSSIWLGWSLVHLPGGITWGHLALLLFLIPLALGIFFAIRVMLCLFALLFTRAEHFQEMYFIFFKMGQRPDRLYNPGLRYLVLLVIPVGMIASVPASIVVDPFNLWVLIGFTLYTAALFLALGVLWRLAIRRYMASG